MPGDVKKTPKVLVVDDDRSLAENLVAYLSKLGYHASAAYGGEEALDLFRREKYDLVVTDLMMPGMDGMELLEAVKVIDGKAVVLVITGYATIESAVEAIRRGAYDFIPKPFKLAELEVVVQRAVERRSLTSSLQLFRGLAIGLMVSVPLWLGVGVAIAWFLGG